MNSLSRLKFYYGTMTRIPEINKPNFFQHQQAVISKVLDLMVKVKKCSKTTVASKLEKRVKTKKSTPPKKKKVEEKVAEAAVKDEDVIAASSKDEDDSPVINLNPKDDVLVNDNAECGVNVEEIQRFSDLPHMPRWLLDGLGHMNLLYPTTIQKLAITRGMQGTWFQKNPHYI